MQPPDFLAALSPLATISRTLPTASADFFSMRRARASATKLRVAALGFASRSVSPPMNLISWSMAVAGSRSTA